MCRVWPGLAIGTQEGHPRVSAKPYVQEQFFASLSPEDRGRGFLYLLLYSRNTELKQRLILSQTKLYI